MMRQVSLPSPHMAFAQYLCKPLPPTPARLLRRRATSRLACGLAGAFQSIFFGQRAVPENTRNCGGGYALASSVRGRLWAWCPDGPVVPVPLASIPARCRDAVAPLAFALAGLFSQQAWAERITFEPSGDATGNIIGHVVIENDEDSSTNTRIIELPGYGELTIQYFTTLNEVTPSGLCCADEVRILDLPEGVLPDRWETTVEENSTATITLYRYVGG